MNGNGHANNSMELNNSNNVRSDTPATLSGVPVVADGNLHENGHAKEKTNGYGVVSTQASDDEGFGDEDEVECGWGRFRPSCLQCFNRMPGFLVFLCLFAITQGMTVNGLVYVVTTTLERRFGLPSVRSGFISSSYDFSVMIIIVFVTYFGERSHKPYWLGIGASIFSVGSLVFQFPHYTTPFYEFQSADFELCDVNRNDTDVCELGTSGSSLSHYFWVFVFAQFLHGLGAAPLYTLGITYIDENVKPKMTSLYIGIFNGASLLGPAIGYLLGGALLDIYTDVKKDPDTLGIDPESPLWIGAWWIGFIVSGIMALLVVIPFLGFPKSLPGAKKLQKSRVCEAHGGSEFTVRSGFGNSLRDFPKACLGLIKNVPFMCINGSACTEWFLLSGFAVFAPKFLESQFNLTASWASIVVGLTVIPAAVFGSIIGGWVVKHFQLRFKGMVRFCLAVIFVSFLCMGAFFVACPNPNFAGITVEYGDEMLAHQGKMNTSDACNKNCGCMDNFEPVCGVDNIMYFSACHAGCTVKPEDDGSQGYYNCSCITLPDSLMEGDPEAISGKCTATCELQPVFLAMLFLLEFFTILAVVPAMTATLRCVPHSQRSFALGLQSLMYRAFGTVPAPVAFGAIIDTTCLLWEYDCDGGGNCWLYDNKIFSRYILILSLCIKFGSLIFFLLALLTYKAPPETPADTAKVDDAPEDNFNSTSASQAPLS
ncbi:solute carrier organic anion transporter family member 4A1-like isoform X2 [Amphiura filiformis]|uniref:solute carrier organic anion transporter family member 4A1-like isoform X2 n=1 Tax=Amphiura filiformis TaxID=82378 RepID=UPI003B216A6E